MSPRRSEPPAARPGRRAGMTLVELAVAITVMSLVAVVMGGLMRAVRTARDHVDGVQTAAAQGRFVVERLRSAVARSGVYRIGSNPTVAGVAVIPTAASPTDRPETLVVWTGGRESSLADQGTAKRFPKANELVIYTPDPAAPQRLAEIVVPTANDAVDFAGSTFATRVRQLIASPSAQKVTLCDRLRLAPDGTGTAAAVRFEAEPTPTDAQVSTTATGTAAWQSLPWAGASSSTSGMRQLLVRIEVQLVTVRGPAGTGTDPSLPVFGAAVKRYQYEK